ncbi:DUF4124 domain-containing protein [Hahella aquimaris]|uniref:DUF4124 domain-containing protein n=1 Tax=Hahella sp. HNIBRBA332 TaxID=3015983 RepID=UPI00273C3CC3|nr:DUF4124 domain-containing protein [Hahella sp. HNIBRBA332]WLQ14661.1 DUF4124 domain-containing protein [Hahella sp. HNIBRBA332]
MAKHIVSNLPISAVAAVLLFCFGASVQAEIYKWVDEHGEVHFSDTRQHKDAKVIKVQPNVTDAQKRDAEQVGQRYQRIYEQYKVEEAARVAHEKERAAQKAKVDNYCAQLRKDINQIDQGYAFARIKDDGTPEYVSDEEIAQRRNKLQALYQEKCAP